MPRKREDREASLAMAAGARIQRSIIMSTGIEYIEAKVLEVCHVCRYERDCLLLPVTSDGGDCPYFERLYEG